MEINMSVGKALLVSFTVLSISVFLIRPIIGEQLTQRGEIFRNILYIIVCLSAVCTAGLLGTAIIELW